MSLLRSRAYLAYIFDTRKIKFSVANKIYLCIVKTAYTGIGVSLSGFI